MADVEPLVRYFLAADGRLRRFERTWFGAVIADGRYPDLYDANYALVSLASDDLTATDVERELFPVVADEGARHEHIVLFRPEECPSLVEELEARGDECHFDEAMRLEGPVRTAPSEHRVEEVLPEDRDEPFWDEQRAAIVEMGPMTVAALDQLIRWYREVQAGGGKRWFVIRDGERIAATAAITVLDGVAYLDDVVTFPEYRRLGMASTLVHACVRAAREAGAEEVWLLADEPDPIRLYRTVGFESAGRVWSSLRPLPATR